MEGFKLFKDRAADMPVYESKAGEPVSPMATALGEKFLAAALASGLEPEDISVTAADVIARIIVIFSPDLKTAEENCNETMKGLLDAVRENFPQQDEITAEVENMVLSNPKMQALKVVADLLRGLEERRRGTKSPVEAPAPTSTNPTGIDPGEIKSC